MRFRDLVGSQQHRCGWIGTVQCHRRRVAVIGAAVLVAGSVQGAAAQDVRSVKAQYDVSFAGVSIGDFNFNSEIDGQRYTIKSSTSIKLLLGTFKWASRSMTEGVVRDAVTPNAFEFNYRSNRKQFRTAVRFARGDVAAIDNQPPVKPSRKRVPLRPEHLKNVMDPMSAIMAMTRGAKRNPCQGSFEVFEGRVRFKLSLESKGKRRIVERGNSGQPRVGYLCRIRCRAQARQDHSAAGAQQRHRGGAAAGAQGGSVRALPDHRADRIWDGCDCVAAGRDHRRTA
jgi:hypothetical protein